MDKNLNRRIVYSALGIALITIATSFLHFNIGIAFVSLSDALIYIISIIFGPFVGMLSGGFGSFFGDMIAYPTTMLYSLIIKGLEGYVVGLLALKINRQMRYKNVVWLIAMFVGSLIMIGGYFLCKALFYGTLETALVSLLPNVLQAFIGMVVALIVLNVLPDKVFKVYLQRKKEL